jgi:hypothetical protein
MSGPVSISSAHLIEPWETRKARSAAARKVSIARATAELATTYLKLKLPVPPSLLPPPPPEPEAIFIPYRIKRKRRHVATGRRVGRQAAGHGTVRATAIRGSRIGRPPSAARRKRLRRRGSGNRIEGEAIIR